MLASAPAPAASDGVARPKRIAPSTDTIRIASGKERGQQRPHHLAEWDVGLLGRQLGTERRVPQCPRDHVEDVEAGEQKAGKEGGGIELDRGHARGRGVDDEEDAGRDQNPEAAARAHHAGGELDVVARPQHGGEGQQPHQRHDRADDAGRGREHRAGDQRRHRQRAGDILHRELQRMEQPVENVGALDHIAHEQEQRHRGQHVARRDLEGLLHQQREDAVLEDLLSRRVVGVVAERHAHRHQRERDGKAQHDDEDEQPQHQHADLRIGHAQAPFWSVCGCSPGSPA